MSVVTSVPLHLLCCLSYFYLNYEDQPAAYLFDFKSQGEDKSSDKEEALSRIFVSYCIHSESMP